MSATLSSRAEARRRRALVSLAGFVPLALCFAFLYALSFLPPDMSRSEIDARGTIRVCMPTEYPPLVTGDSERPGFDVELVRMIAERAGWRVVVVSNAAMGRDFNPRSWRVTRAQCNFLAGGVALTDISRSFLDTTPGHLNTGWMMISATPQDAPQPGQRVGYYPGVSGLDRIRLGQYLRGVGVTVVSAPSVAALHRGLVAGEYDIGVTEALAASSSFGQSEDFTLTWLPEELGSFSLGFGFWRGDSTLRRHVVNILTDLEEEGAINRLAARYGLVEEVLCEIEDEECE